MFSYYLELIATFKLDTLSKDILIPVLVSLPSFHVNGNIYSVAAYYSRIEMTYEHSYLN